MEGWIGVIGILVRQRKDDRLKALAVLLYYLGLSCRKIRDGLREWADVSHEAILGTKRKACNPRL